MEPCEGWLRAGTWGELGVGRRPERRGRVVARRRSARRGEESPVEVSARREICPLLKILSFKFRSSIRREPEPDPGARGLSPPSRGTGARDHQRGAATAPSPPNPTSPRSPRQQQHGLAGVAEYYMKSVIFCATRAAVGSAVPVGAGGGRPGPGSGAVPGSVDRAVVGVRRIDEPVLLERTCPLTRYVRERTRSPREVR